MCPATKWLPGLLTQHACNRSLASSIAFRSTMLGSLLNRSRKEKAEQLDEELEGRTMTDKVGREAEKLPASMKVRVWLIIKMSDSCLPCPNAKQRQ